jgi:hypothetical protein
MTTIKADAAMNHLTIERLGTATPGKEDLETHLFGDEKPPVDKRLMRYNNPVPIVLWNRNAKPSVLYYVYEKRQSTGEVNQRIDYLENPGKGFMGHLKAMTDAYPISFNYNGHNPVKRLFNGIGDFYTADVNGDGVDELIVIRFSGKIDVYDREKRIMTTLEPYKPDLFEYKPAFPNTVRLKNHDEVFFTFTRKLYDDAKPSDQDKKYNEKTPETWVVRISPRGIDEIHPRLKDGSEPFIDSAVGLNRPGSDKVDELDVIGWYDGKKGCHLSRHTLDGKAIDVPRAIYTDYNMYCSAYGFPRSNQFIVSNRQENIMYFITPDKPVNWIKTIRFNDLFPDRPAMTNIADTTLGGLAVNVFRIGHELYALDAQGKFHTSMKPGSPTSARPVPFMTLKSESNLHKIIHVSPVDPSMESYLVIESREPGKRELSLEELEKAGKMFLSDDDWKDCQFYLALRYSDIVHELAEDYCKNNKIKMPVIHSYEDIKNKLPGFYQSRVNDSRDSYRISLNTSLFLPLEEGGYDVNSSDYKNKIEYKKWLNRQYFSPQLVLSIQSSTMGIQNHKTLEEYYYKKMDPLDVYLPPINVRAFGKHGTSIMVLRNKTLDMDSGHAYYKISW